MILRMEHHFARQVARGVLSYRRHKSSERWILYHREPFEVGSDEGEYDGVLACVQDDCSMEERFLAGPLPCVAVCNRPTNLPLPMITLDDCEIGRVAAAHFLHKQYRELAFVGEDAVYSDRRLSGFREALLEAGYEPKVFLKELDLAWLESIHEPVGVFASNDVRGQDVLNQCATAGVSVPGKVAVLGVDNDDLLCETCDPPLSSIVTPHRRVGWLAAEMLEHRMLQREQPPLQQLPPGPVIERGSTDNLAVPDSLVQRAVERMRTPSGAAMNIAQLTRELGVPRRTLEAHFQRSLQQTPLQVLHSHRLARAVSLLVETDWTIKRIAEACGYATAPRLNDAFHRHLGRTPSEYREQAE